MIELLGEVEPYLAADHRLVRVPEKPEGLRRNHAATDPRVVPSIARGMQAVPLRLIELHSLVQMDATAVIADDIPVKHARGRPRDVNPITAPREGQSLDRDVLPCDSHRVPLAVTALDR